MEPKKASPYGAKRWREIRGDKGFTLIEMVIALFIVSVMMAMVLPNLQVAGSNAAKTGCEGNQRMIRAALTEYYLTNHHYPSEPTTAGVLSELKAAGYLNAIPACPGGGEYQIAISPDGTTAAVSCSVHGELGD